METFSIWFNLRRNVDVDRQTVDTRLPASTSRKGAANGNDQKYGPYVAVELFLPGGTLVAIALYLFRRAAVDPARCRSTIG